jgi:cell wall-associated NlpC family hydrolase
MMIGGSTAAGPGALAQLHERSEVVAEARTWLRTPYAPLARIKGVGVDCAQILIAVFEACGLVPAPDVGIYSPEWHLHHSAEIYLGWITQYCAQVETPQPGDIALFRYGRCVSHSGIITCVGENPWMIHSYIGQGVLEEEILPNGPLAARLHGYWTLKGWAQ